MRLTWPSLFSTGSSSTGLTAFCSTAPCLDQILSQLVVFSPLTKRANCSQVCLAKMLCSLFSKRRSFYFLFWITLQNSRLTFEVLTATSHSPQLSWKKRFIYNIVWRFRTACCKAHFRLEVHINIDNNWWKSLLLPSYTIQIVSKAWSSYSLPGGMWLCIKWLN